MKSLKKINKSPQTLRDIVQDRMREAIIEGVFAPGERLVERPLCEQLGVSRTVIRETIRYMEAEGLVEILPNRGPIVATLNWSQARQIYDIRRQLEGAAAAACARVILSDQADELTEALVQVEVHRHDAHWGGILQATTRFYEIIFMTAGHEIAWEIVQRLNGRISRLRALTIGATDRAQPGFAHLTAIHDAILSAEDQAARHAVEVHIDDAARAAHGFLSQ